jgi:hypothetical protein
LVGGCVPFCFELGHPKVALHGRRRVSIGMLKPDDAAALNARRMRAIMYAAVIVALAGCGGDATGSDAAALAGEYELVSVGGQSLPWWSDASGSSTVRSGVLWLREDGTLQVRTSVGRAGTVGQLRTVAGTWRVDGQRLRLVFHSWYEPSSVTGSFSAGEVRVPHDVERDGGEHVYRRQ